MQFYFIGFLKAEALEGLTHGKSFCRVIKQEKYRGQERDIWIGEFRFAGNGP